MRATTTVMPLPTAVSRVSSRAAAASSAAASAPTSAAMRVLARPGTGALATTSTVGRLIAAPPGSPGPPGWCRAAIPTPSTGCRPPADGTRCRSPDRPAGPGGLHHQLERVAEAPVADVESDQVVASADRIGARSCTPNPLERRSQVASSVVPARACQGQTPRPTGRRRPTAIVTPSSITAREQLRQLREVHRVVAVDHGQVLRRRGHHPCVDRSAVARTGFVDHRGAEARRATSAVPSEEAVVDHDRGIRRARHRARAGARPPRPGTG